MRFKQTPGKHVIKVIIQKNNDDESKSNRDNTGFNDQLDRIDSTIDASEDLIESRTFEIASGGLIVSLTILSLLRDSEHFPDWGMTPTIVIWGIFTLCILLHYASQFLAKHSSEQMSKIIIKKMNNGEKYNHEELNEMQYKKHVYVRILNTLTPILLVIGVISLIVFTSYCFLVS